MVGTHSTELGAARRKAQTRISKPSTRFDQQWRGLDGTPYCPDQGLEPARGVVRVALPELMTLSSRPI